MNLRNLSNNYVLIGLQAKNIRGLYLDYSILFLYCVSTSWFRYDPNNHTGWCYRSHLHHVGNDSLTDGDGNQQLANYDRRCTSTWFSIIGCCCFNFKSHWNKTQYENVACMILKNCRNRASSKVQNSCLTMQQCGPIAGPTKPIVNKNQHQVSESPGDYILTPSELPILANHSNFQI